VLNDAVADLAMGLVLATSRNLLAADQYVRAGRWLEAPFPFGRNLTGKTLGIVGLGAIGEEIAYRAEAFKMKVAYHNRRPERLPFDYYDSLPALARASDVLLSMLPGTPDTRRIMDAEIFRALGPEGIFINVGRGSTVDEEALIEALQQGTIAGAGLDVYANEPQVPEALLSMPNVVLFPHIGSATTETRRAMGQLVLDNLAAHFSDRPLLTPVRQVPALSHSSSSVTMPLGSYQDTDHASSAALDHHIIDHTHPASCPRAEPAGFSHGDGCRGHPGALGHDLPV